MRLLGLFGSGQGWEGAGIAPLTEAETAAEGTRRPAAAGSITCAELRCRQPCTLIPGPKSLSPLTVNLRATPAAPRPEVSLLRLEPQVCSGAYLLYHDWNRKEAAAEEAAELDWAASAFDSLHDEVEAGSDKLRAAEEADSEGAEGAGGGQRGDGGAGAGAGGAGGATMLRRLILPTMETKYSMLQKLSAFCRSAL